MERCVLNLLDGKVGIGTTAPDELLHLYKASGNTGLEIEAVSSGDPIIRFVSANNRTGDIFYTDATTLAKFSYDHSAQAFKTYAHNNTTVDFYLSETEAYFPSQDVGIGTTSPFSKLQVGTNTFSGGNGMHNDSRVGISNHGVLTGLMLASTYNDAAHPEYGLVFVQGPNTSSYNVWSISPDGPAKGSSLIFNYQAQSTNIHSPTNAKVCFQGSSGNVGIGTTSPSTILQVESTDPIITLERNNNGSAAGAINFQGNDNVVDWQLGTNQAIGLGFEINEGGGTNNRFYIAPGGYTKITDDGDTTWNGYDFHAITQSAASEPTVMIYNDNAGGNNYGINVIHRSTSANTTGRFFLGATNNGGTENIKIYTNGNIQNTNNSYTQLSDSRLKENIVDATSKLEEIKRLRVVNWNFIGDDLKQIGMVAQEVEEIFPGLVDVTGDNQIIHGTTYENVKSLKYSVLVPILVKAIQELEARVTELENN